MATPAEKQKIKHHREVVMNIFQTSGDFNLIPTVKSQFHFPNQSPDPPAGYVRFAPVYYTEGRLIRTMAHFVDVKIANLRARSDMYKFFSKVYETDVTKQELVAQPHVHYFIDENEMKHVVFYNTVDQWISEVFLRWFNNNAGTVPAVHSTWAGREGEFYDKLEEFCLKFGAHGYIQKLVDGKHLSRLKGS